MNLRNVSHNNEKIDFRLGFHATDGSATDMMDCDDHVAESVSNKFPFRLEHRRPLRIICTDL